MVLQKILAQFFPKAKSRSGPQNQGSSTAYLVVGLGNPGDHYVRTRHNIGFRAVDALANDLGSSWTKERSLKSLVSVGTVGAVRVILLKPQTFMNLSGESVQAACRFYRLTAQQCVVVCDDVHLDLGRVKLSLQGGMGGHNGLASVRKHLGQDFWRFRIGMGEKPHPHMDLADYVLGVFNPDEEALMAAEMPRYVEKLKQVIDKSPQAAMNEINIFKKD